MKEVLVPSETDGLQRAPPGARVTYLLEVTAQVCGTWVMNGILSSEASVVATGCAGRIGTPGVGGAKVIG